MENEIKEKIRSFLEQFFGDHHLQDDEDIFSTGYVNSLFAMQLVMFIEKEYHIRLENDELDLKNFQTLNVISQFLEQKVSV